MDVPYFLIALPQLGDETFMHTVVLVTSHSAEGATGLILNKALVDEEEGPALMRAEIKDLAGNTLFEFNEDLFDGGPVNDESIFALHEFDDVGPPEAQVTEGLFLSSDPQIFQKLLENPALKDRRRFFLGSSQWEAGQLDSELRTASWMPVPFDRSFLFQPVGENKGAWRDQVWIKALQSRGLDPFTLMGQGSSDAGSN